MPVKSPPKKGDMSVAQFLAFQMDASKKTQRDIASEVGYKNANVLTMFKQGLTKVPISTAPRLATALGIDPGFFLKMVIQEYMPELLTEIEKHIGGLCTRNELRMVNVIRDATKGKDPELDEDQAKRLAAWAKGLL